ncbi:MAG TPA: 16S rRNA (uracil(1498)-N(3))-methyltransferase [Lapillicoccus sp.]|nr:16S rRNA (uracil(1498)-N(3))-methyltransferase [Lapillicoccus sp.]
MPVADVTARMFILDSPAWASAAAGDVVEVGGAEGQHAVTVVRLRPGETVLLGGGGRRAEATVTHTGKSAFAARLETVVDEPENDPRFVLVQALAKAGRDEQAVETATELGVDEVVPWQAARGVVVWRGREREEKGRRRWRSVCVAASKQSRRGRVPVVSEPAATSDVAARVTRAALGLVLDEAATEPLAAVELPIAGDVVVVVGPEGGISDAELAELVAAGGRAVRLGPEVLRSSTAGPAALAVLAASLRWR